MIFLKIEKGKIFMIITKEAENIIYIINEYFYNNLDIIFVYLFGSFAVGKNNSMSDIDLAVYFKENTFDIDNYMKIKMDLTEILKRDVDLVVLNTAKPFIKSRIINKHIKVLCRDSLVEGQFIDRSLGEYFDIKPFMDKSYSKVIIKMSEGDIFG